MQFSASNSGVGLSGGRDRGPFGLDDIAADAAAKKMSSSFSVTPSSAPPEGAGKTVSFMDPARDESGAGHRPSGGEALVPTSGTGPWLPTRPLVVGGETIELVGAAGNSDERDGDQCRVMPWLNRPVMARPPIAAGVTDGHEPTHLTRPSFHLSFSASPSAGAVKAESLSVTPSEGAVKTDITAANESSGSHSDDRHCDSEVPCPEVGSEPMYEDLAREKESAGQSLAKNASVVFSKSAEPQVQIPEPVSRSSLGASSTLGLGRSGTGSDDITDSAEATVSVQGEAEAEAGESNASSASHQQDSEARQNKAGQGKHRGAYIHTCSYIYTYIYIYMYVYLY